MANVRACEICKQLIEEERAEGCPETTLCLKHAREAEKYGGEFLRSTSIERTSKPGSLKRNYGGVSVRLRRNYDGLRKLKEAYLASQAE